MDTKRKTDVTRLVKEIRAAAKDIGENGLESLDSEYFREWLDVVADRLEDLDK